jgi:hypothetical protein
MPMTFGLLWSVTAVGIAVFAAPFVLRPSADGPSDVGDRFAVSVAVGAGLGVLVAEVLSVQGGPLMPPKSSTDVGFWVAAGTCVGIYAGRGKRRAFMSAAARVADVVPWVLLSYGVYLSLCWLRSTCASIGGAPNSGVDAELVAGILLMASAAILHRAWPLGEQRQVVTGVVAIAAARIVLAPLHLPVGDRPVSALVAVVVVLTAGVLGALRIRRTRRDAA